mmetsp:Transcript_78476/g.138680  ORF Transcript_78476/g.138680 Transcript_78476/m.138680 type:complete len:85 (-) Transcript_78476:657-911(-)
MCGGHVHFGYTFAAICDVTHAAIKAVVEDWKVFKCSQKNQRPLFLRLTTCWTPPVLASFGGDICPAASVDMTSHFPTISQPGGL